MSQPANTEISPWKASQFRGRCGAKRCPREAIPGGNYCGVCGPRVLARKRRSNKKRRAELDRKGLCLGGCGRKRKRGRKRCEQCLTAQSRRGDGHENRGDGQTQSRGRIVHEDRSKYGWAPTARYVGRSRRGAPSLEDRARDGLIDLAEVRKLFEAFTARYEMAIREGVFAMGKAQRDQALRMLAELGARSTRMLSSVVLTLDPDADVVPANDK